ncbi:phosphate-starvation-inducible PsiE family protein [Magnetospira thiophila]
MEQLIERAQSANHKFHGVSDMVGNFMVDMFHAVALFGIGAAVIWSALQEFIALFDKPHATIEDILLLFIYLELGAMVGIYFRTKHMPVRFLVYVAITALTRMMIGYIGMHHIPDWGILIISGAILVLAFAVLVLRYGSHKYPSQASITDSKATDAPGEGRTGVAEV